MTTAGQVACRRTFAIISHPDAGKTTLTEKLLLRGGALQFAGAVRAKGQRRRTQSDWMAIERQRGISVVTSVMTFLYDGHVINMLDTPGHEDFSEDTFRTLSAVDSAVMVIDAAKGIEEQTLKLFEVCRLRDVPIITFINKVDQPGRDPFDLLHEIEETLALDTVPYNWPVGYGRNLAGLYDLAHDRVCRGDDDGGFSVNGSRDPQLETLLSPSDRDCLDGVELAKECRTLFDQKAYESGCLTPVFFGSALRDVGVRDLLGAMIALAPAPCPRAAAGRIVYPDEEKMTGFIFKIQANMDRNHRDRIAFLRVCSGVLRRGMKVYLPRAGKMLALRTPQFFFAQERSLVEEAVAGDIVGIHNYGAFRIGDTVTEGEDLAFHGIPSFSPEILRRVRASDAMESKKMREALRQLAEEGVVQIFIPVDGSGVIVGVVGALQLDVLATRLTGEYNVDVTFEVPRFRVARWILSADRAVLDDFVARHRSAVAEDLDGAAVFFAESEFMLNYEMERATGIRFMSVKSCQGPGFTMQV